MNKRLLEIIKYKTGGKQTEFAAFMGWSPAYLAKLLAGGSFGLRPIVAILTNLPEIDARWLLLGEGNMIEENRLNDLKRSVFQSVAKVLGLGKYITVMTAEELACFEDAVISAEKVKFDASTISKWERLLTEEQSDD